MRGAIRVVLADVAAAAIFESHDFQLCKARMASRRPAGRSDKSAANMTQEVNFRSPRIRSGAEWFTTSDVGRTISHGNASLLCRRNLTA